MQFMDGVSQRPAKIWTSQQAAYLYSCRCASYPSIIGIYQAS